MKSPLTYGSWEYGDVYKSDVMEYAVRTDVDYDDKRPIEPFSDEALGILAGIESGETEIIYY